MKARHLIPFAVLLAWQVVPVRVDTNPPANHFSISFGYGYAQFEDASYDCEGNFISSERVELRSAGARADMVTSNNLRVTAFGGRMTSNRPDGSGVFGGFQVGKDWKSVGLGGGLTAGVPFVDQYGGSDRAARPNVFLRLGNADGTSFRTELLSPSEVFGAVGMARTGVAFHQGSRGGTSAFLGLSVDPFSVARGFADLSISTGPNLDVLLRGEVGGGHWYTPYSLAVGTRYRFATSR